jgi:hypothetical protein
VLTEVEMQQKRMATDQDLKAKEVQQDLRQQQIIVSEASENLLDMQRRLKLLEERVEEQGRSLQDVMEEGLREHGHELLKHKAVHEHHARESKKRHDDSENEQQRVQRKIVEAEEQVRGLQMSSDQLGQVRTRVTFASMISVMPNYSVCSDADNGTTTGGGGDIGEESGPAQSGLSGSNQSNVLHDLTNCCLRIV